MYIHAYTVHVHQKTPRPIDSLNAVITKIIVKKFNYAITVVSMVIKMLEDAKRQWTMNDDELMKKHTCSLKATLLQGQ